MTYSSQPNYYNLNSFMMKKTKSILICLFLGFCSSALAQNIQVTGRLRMRLMASRSLGQLSLSRENVPLLLPTTTVTIPSRALPTQPSYLVM